MRNAALHQKEILSRIQKHGCVLLLDFDGTLSPIVDDYRTARISPQAKAALKILSSRIPIAIVSGRSIDDVRSKVGIPGLSYAGCHGLAIAHARRDTSPRIPAGSQKIFASATRALAALAKKYRCRVEDKGRSYALHFRHLAGPRRAAFLREAQAIVESDRLRAGVRVLVHEGAFDIMPECGVSKGTAARALVRNFGERGAVPVYVGDGLTDEDAFEALEDGITIRVGYIEGSAANYFFRTRRQVDSFLRTLAVLHSASSREATLRVQ